MSDARRVWPEGVALLGLVGLALWHVWLLGGPAFILDDAYIVLNNAEALWRPDTAFPEEAPLRGSTSLLHTLLVAVLLAAVDGAAALLLAAWLAVGLLVLGAMRLAREAGLGPGWRLCAGIAALGLGDPLQVHLNGLETGLMLAATVWAAVALARPRAPLWLGALAGAMPFVRPELGVLGALAVLTVAWSAMRAGEASRAIAMLAVPCAVGGGLLALQFGLSGTLLPETGEAKRIFFELYRGAPEGGFLGAIRLAVLFVVFFCGPVALGLLAPIGRAGKVALAFAVLVVLLLAWRYPAIIAQNHFRYVYALPLAGLVGLVLLAARDRPLGRLLGRVGLALALAFQAAQLASLGPGRIEAIAAKRDRMLAFAEWVDTNLDPAQPLLIHDIGAVAFASQQRLYDMVGLRTAAAVGVNRAALADGRTVGHALAQMARRSGACHIAVSGGWNKFDALTAPFEAVGWRLDPIGLPWPDDYSIYALHDPQGRRCPYG